MKKISFGILICCLLCGIMPVTALADAGVDTHVDHPVCGASCPHMESHTTVTSWTTWDGTNTGLSNSCYHISSDTDIIDTISISGEVNLCLNGHTLAAKNIVVGEDAMLTLCDCSAEQTGKLILSPELSDGSITGIMVSADGKYTQYGGNVELSGSGTEAGQTSIFGVYSDGGNVNLHGGSITVDCQYDSGEPAAFAVSLYGGTLSATDGSITSKVKSGDTENDCPYACGIDLNDGVSAEISGVTVSASAQGYWASASALGCFGSETIAKISDGIFNASAKGESSGAFGVYIDGGEVNVEDGSFTSEAEGMDDTDCYSYGIRCAGGSAVVSGGTFSTTTEGDGSVAYGIFLKNASASVTSGTFTASTEGDESESYGLYAWNNDFSTENSIAVSGGSFSAEVKGETNESSVACGIYIDDSCEKTTAVLSDIASFHARAECLYSNAYAVFNECPGLSITGGRYTAEAECTDFGYAYGVDDSAGIAITGGSFQTVSGWSAYGVSFDEAGGSVSGISASATAPHATAVFFSGDGLVTDCDLTATGTEDYAASALALLNPSVPPVVTLSGGTLTAIGEDSVGVEISDGALTLEGAPMITADRAQISIVPTDSSGEGWYTGGTVRLGDSFSGGNYTLSCETGLTGFAEGTVVVENVSAVQRGLFTLIPMEGRYADWELVHNAENNTLCIAPVVSPQPPSYSDSDSDPTYRVELPEGISGGKVEARPKWAESGDTVTLTVTPEDGFILSALDVTDVRGNKLEVTDRGDGTYTFRMPSRKVTVTATFAPDGSYSTCSGDHTCPIWSYTDIEPTAWYHDGVHYIIEKGLMTGYGNGIFKPDANTSRAMIAVMLWRLEGSPVVNYLLDFEDVKAEAWYTEAIRWAKSEGIIGGYGNGYWGPDDTVIREQMVTILWRYAQYKGYDVSVGEDTNILSYDDAFDVAEYAIPAMQWACGAGIMNGYGNGYLGPNDGATRAQAAQMLKNFIEKAA